MWTVWGKSGMSYRAAAAFGMYVSGVAARQVPQVGPRGQGRGGVENQGFQRGRGRGPEVETQAEGLREGMQPLCMVGTILGGVSRFMSHNIASPPSRLTSCHLLVACPEHA